MTGKKRGMEKVDYRYALMDEEITSLNEFRKKHQSAHHAQGYLATAVVLQMSSLGMTPSVKCLVCGEAESITCDERVKQWEGV